MSVLKRRRWVSGVALLGCGINCGGVQAVQVRVNQRKSSQNAGQEPTAEEADEVRVELDESNMKGISAVNAANTAAAVVKVQDSLADMAALVKEAQRAASGAARAAELADGVNKEMDSNVADIESLVQQTAAAKEAMAVGSKGWLARAQEIGTTELEGTEGVTVKDFADWEFNTKHDIGREGRIAAFAVSSPFKAAIKRIEASIAAHYAKAETASQEAFSLRNQAQGLATAASMRVDPVSAQADVQKINVLSLQANDATAKAQALRAKGNELQLQIPVYQQAAEYVAAEAANRFDPSVAIPATFQQALPPTGDALVLPDP